MAGGTARRSGASATATSRRPTSLDALLYTVYVASMAAGALVFVARSPRRATVGVSRRRARPGLVYLALGLGTTEVAGQTTYWARYADWIVTTPLLVTALGMTATTDADTRRHAPTPAVLICADVVMILSASSRISRRARRSG